MSRKRVENASDLELQRLLIKNGYPNIPITETTRSIIVKKLKKHILVKNCEDRNSNILQGIFHANNTVIENKLGPVNNEHINIGMIKPPGHQTVNKSSKTMLTLHKFQRTCGIYAPAPILDSDFGEQSDCFNYINNSGAQNKYKSSNIEDRSESVLLNTPEKYKHGVVTRLLSLREKTLLTGLQPLSCQSEEGLTSHKLQYKNFFPNRFGRGSAVGSSVCNPVNWCSCLRWPFNTFGFKKQIFIPYALISLFAAFLILLTFIYIIIHLDTSSTIHEKNTRFILCSDINRKHIRQTNIQMDKTTTNCIENTLVSVAITLSKELVECLVYRAKHTNCNDYNSNISISVSTNEFVQYQLRKYSVLRIRNTLRYLEDMKYLIQHNPNWGVVISDAQIAINLSDNNPFHNTQNVHFVLKKHSIPIVCIVYKKIQKFFVIIGSASVLMIVFSAAYVAFCYVKHWKSNRLVAIDQLTKDILDELLNFSSLKRSEANSKGENIVVINHLRDKLLPLKTRGTLLWSWNEALRMLELNESRIQFGVCRLNGEELRTMQWIGNTLDQIKCGHSKQWQSQAFDNVNTITNPPTSCLKIRHMYDASETNNPYLASVIKEAILKKVGGRCKICDIQIDKESCCVYVRCASAADAGVVHNQINGWWFDNRLVSIKFLRLHRFLYRFPKSDENSF